MSKISYSQDKIYQVKVSETYDILPVQKINDIVQDEQGFFWIPAKPGISRFDGHGTESFQLEVKDSLGNIDFKTANITSVAMAKNGDLWMCAKLGEFARFDRKRNKLITVDIGNGKRWENYRKILLEEEAIDTLDILHNADSIVGNFFKDKIFVDSRYNIWMSLNSNGFCKVVLDTNSFDQEKIKVKDFQWFYHLSTGLPEHFRADEYFEDNTGKIWITSIMGLLELDPDTGTHELHQVTNSPDSAFLNHYVYGNLIVGDSMLYLGSHGRGLVTFNLRTKEMESYPFTTYIEDELKGHTEEELERIHKMWNATDCSILERTTGKIWVNGVIFGPERHYSFLFDIKTKEFERVDVNYEDNKKVPNNLFGRKMVQDESNNFWISKSLINEPTAGTALLKMEQSNKSFDYLGPGELDNLNAGEGNIICPDSLGNLWTANKNGLIYIDRKNGNKVRHYPYNGKDHQALYPGKPVPGDFFGYGDLKIDKRGKLWIGTNYGLYTMDPGTGQWEIDSVLYEYKKNEDIQLACNSISLTNDGKLWLSYHKKIIYYDPETKDFTAYNYPAFRFNQASALVWKVLWESDERVWFGFFVGGPMLSFNPKEIKNPLNPDLSKFKEYNYSQANPMLIDSRGRLWARSYGGEGVVYVDLKTGHAKRFTKKDGLCDNSTASIVEDKKGRIWISTVNGLSCFDPESETFKNFFEKDGLLSNIIGRGNISNGEVFFCTLKGLLRFYPENIKHNKVAPKLEFTGFELFGEEVPIGTENSPLQKHVSMTDKIELAYWQNDMVFRFVALHFDDPVKNKYKVLLDHYDREWRDIGNERFATYTNLSPGSYTLRVKAANKDGVWNVEGISLKINILPPWWATWWAYTVYAISFIGITYAIYRFQLNKKIHENEAKRLQELDSFKTRFYTNITHEFRTPLTVILGLAKDNIIKRNAISLLQLVNQMLDLSKLESGLLKLHMLQGNVVQYIRYLTETFHSLAEDKHIIVHFLSEQQDIIMDFDREKLQHIVSNLLSNAIKFTPEGGNVYLLIDRVENGKKTYLQLKVKDTGVGIPADKLRYIFDRFYQVDGSVSRVGEGTGIGLSLTKELIEMLDGEIIVHSHEGKGTEVVMRLPITNAAPHSEDKQDILENIYTNDVKEKHIIESNNERAKKELPLSLLVEDNPDVLHYLITILQNSYRIETAKNGQEGINKAKVLLPDIIISDVMMPIKDGYSLSDELKSNLETSHIPIILLTAKASEDDRIEGLKSGADAYLTKPFNKEELEVRIRKLIEQRENLWRAYKSSSINTEPKEKLNKRDKDFLSKSHEVLEKYKSDPAFNGERLQKELGVSRTLLHIKLKALTGMSTTSFIRIYRLKYAAKLINEGYGSLTQIAFEAGFNNQSYFTRAFKEYFKVPPSEFKTDNA